MTLTAPTRAFLAFLQKNPHVRSQIRAAPDKTILYAGGFFRPIWKDMEQAKRADPGLADKETLGDVLGRITLHGSPHVTLRAYVQAVEAQVPYNPDGFILWRALSGLFAANAVGRVSFCVGSGVTSVNSKPDVEERKVFAVTELHVLLRNPHVDPLTKDILGYFSRCVQGGEAGMNFGFTAA